MATTTTNFGWDIPQSTDLVKDGATAIAALGQDIDTALVDLKGGTTGQVLSKNSNTDLDFTWVAQDDSNAIQNAIVDAKGDLITATAADTPARLASSGVNNDVLLVDTSTSTGLKWGAAPSAARNYTLINAGGTALTGAATINVSGISGKDSLLIVINGASSANIANFEMRFNSDSNLKYDYCYLQQNSGSTAVDKGFGSNNSIDWAGIAANSGTVSLVGKVEGCNSSGLKYFQFNAYSSSLGNARIASYTYSGTSTISSVNVISSSGNFDAGTIYVYGA